MRVRYDIHRPNFTEYWITIFNLSTINYRQMKPNKLLFISLPLIIICFSCNKKATTTKEYIPENRVIYEVFVRNFSPEGNLKGVEKQIPRLRELGVDVVWLMPIYELGDTGRWGAYSSPYAIKNYTEIDPDNGSKEDLRDLVETIHDYVWKYGLIGWRIIPRWTIYGSAPTRNFTQRKRTISFILSAELGEMSMNWTATMKRCRTRW